MCSTQDITALPVNSNENYLIIYTGDHQMVYSEDGTSVLVQDKTSGDLVFINTQVLFPEKNNNLNEDYNENELDVDYESTSNESNETVKNSQSKKWTDADTFLLIRSIETNYSKFEHSLKKNVYDEIALEINKYTDHKVTALQVDTKWKNLKMMYKKIKSHNEISGNTRKVWKFYNAIDMFMAKKPEINPVAVASSTSEEVEVDNCDEQPQPKRKRDSDVERRHQERMRRQDKFLDLFEQFVNKETKNA